jgi:hypothetical protein
MWIVLLAIRSIQCYIKRILWHRINIYFYLLTYFWGVTRFSFEICLVQPTCQFVRINVCKIVTQLLCYSFDLCILGTCHTLYLTIIFSFNINVLHYIIRLHIMLQYIYIYIYSTTWDSTWTTCAGTFITQTIVDCLIGPIILHPQPPPPQPIPVTSEFQNVG